MYFLPSAVWDIGMENQIQGKKSKINDGFEAFVAVDVGFSDDQYLPVGKVVLMPEAIQNKHCSLGTPNFSMGLNDHRKKQESVSELPITKQSVK